MRKYKSIEETPIIWVGSSLEDVKKLPHKPKRDIGYALSVIQQGEYPHNAKPLKGLSGVHEIKVSHDTDTYRSVYAINTGNAIYVLHVFKKKSKRGTETPKPDMDIIRNRLKMAREHAHED
jgi:phage-related protein